MSNVRRLSTCESVKTIANNIFLHPELREQIIDEVFAIIDEVFAIIDDECSSLCSRAQPTPFRCCQISELPSFTWDRYIQEMERKSPILVRLLRRIVSHSDHRNEQKRTGHHNPGISMSAAVLLKERLLGCKHTYP